MIDITIRSLNSSADPQTELRFVNANHGRITTTPNVPPKIIAREKVNDTVWCEIEFPISNISGFDPEALMSALRLITK